MPAKRRPSSVMEPELGESKAHEASESPEDETREGTEDAPPTSRKRSARGASRTKAPMDAEGGCCNEKKGKAPCAACASGKSCSGAKRGDALTPWEYLDAAELGIQNRSRAYIRARLDAEQRLDAGVKCGGGYIAQGKKCKNGASGAPVKRNAAGVAASDKHSFKKQQKAWGKRAAIAGAIGGGAGQLIQGLASGQGIGKTLAQTAAGAGVGALVGKAAGHVEGTLRAAGNRTARAYGRSRENSRATQAALAKLAPKQQREYEKAKAGGADRKALMELTMKHAVQAGRSVDRNTTQIWTNENKKWSQVEKERRAKAKRRDSVWASGFTSDSTTWAI